MWKSHLREKKYTKGLLSLCHHYRESFFSLLADRNRHRNKNTNRVIAVVTLEENIKRSIVQHTKAFLGRIFLP